MPLLSQLIDLPEKPLVSLVGAGGKTTTMYTLARELARQDKCVITTTTTQIFQPSQDETEKLIIEAETSLLLHAIKNAWQHYRRVTVANRVNDAGKLFGLQPDIPALLLSQGMADAVIIEADGARHRLIKAPAEYEPVVPAETNIALLLMSAQAINRPLSEEIAHRPERIAAITGIATGDKLTPGALAQLITSEQGALKSIPSVAKAYLLVTHAAAEHHEALRELARLVRRSQHITGVLYSEQPGVWDAA